MKQGGNFNDPMYHSYLRSLEKPSIGPMGKLFKAKQLVEYRSHKKGKNSGTVLHVVAH